MHGFGPIRNNSRVNCFSVLILPGDRVGSRCLAVRGFIGRVPCYFFDSRLPAGESIGILLIRLFCRFRMRRLCPICRAGCINRFACVILPDDRVGSRFPFVSSFIGCVPCHFCDCRLPPGEGIGILLIRFFYRFRMRRLCPICNTDGIDRVSRVILPGNRVRSRFLSECSFIGCVPCHFCDHRLPAGERIGILLIRFFRGIRMRRLGAICYTDGIYHVACIILPGDSISSCFPFVSSFIRRVACHFCDSRLPAGESIGVLPVRFFRGIRMRGLCPILYSIRINCFAVIILPGDRIRQDGCRLFR